MVRDPSVLIVGAGPTGLAHALWLTRQGVPVRIVDKDAGPGETSRAMAVQARTLELYRQLDLAEAVVAAGHPTLTMNLWADGRRRARLPLADAGADLTPYPFILVYPQDQHERLLVERLAAMGVQVERDTECLSFEEVPDGVVTRLRLPDGTEQRCRSAYLAGCDGARSPIRHQLGVGFDGGTYRQTFYVADVQLHGLDPAGEAHIALDSADFIAVLPYGDAGRSRLIGIVTDGDPDTLTFADVGHRAIDRLGVEVAAVHWFSTYRVHHRVADAFRRGRVFLLGDAAHVHSPAGGQGMNTGIGDAINLAWKLAQVLEGRAADALLDSYGQERRAFAARLVETTDRMFSFVTAGGDFADFVRTRIAPLVAGLAYRVDGVREMVFRTLSQITLNYHGSGLSSGRAGRVEGGDRMPWVRSAGTDNHASLSRIAWQLHVYGEAPAELQAWGARRGVPVHAFAWDDAHERAGLAPGAAYLLRPDTHVALADPQPTAAALDRYLAARGLAIGAAERPGDAAA